MNENPSISNNNKSQNLFSEAQKQWIKEKNVFPDSIVLKTNRGGDVVLKILERDHSGYISSVGDRLGLKGFILKVVDTYGVILAAKICLKDDYNGSRNEEHEATLASKLEQAAELFVIPREVGVVNLTLDDSLFISHWTCFLTPWVEGVTLKQHLKNDSTKTTPQMIMTVARSLLEAVYYLQEQGLKHDDLHAGNIMLARQPAKRFSPDGQNAVTIKVIDTGSLKTLENPTNKIQDDRSSYLGILVELYNLLHKDRLLASQYPRFVKLFREFIMQMADSDQSRFFPQETDITDKLRQLEDASRSAVYEPAGVFSPFDAISAEHLASDSILVQLFEDNLPWFASLSSSDPNVLTGPRGCGKSMAFRYLCARTHLLDPNSARTPLKEIPFLGIYISCSIELQNNLMGISRDEHRVKKSTNVIETYFQLVLLKELFRTLASLSENLDVAAIYGLNEVAFNQAITFIESRSAINALTFSGGGVSGRLHAIVNQLETLRYETSNALRLTTTPPCDLVTTYVAELIEHIAKHSNGFNNRKVCFMLDDYTDHRIKPSIQRVLNKIIWERRPYQTFKVSAEKYGFISEDIDGLRLDIYREFSPIDTGDAFLSEAHDPKAFVTSLINRRLAASKWKGTSEQIIGISDPKSDQGLANLIRDAHKPGKVFYYHGIEMLSRLLCGDVATLIQVTREIFKRGTVNETSTTLVPAKTQHEAILDVSKALVERIQSHYPFGLEMHKIATEYGGMVREIQINGRLISVSRKDEKNPARLLQIELSNENPNTIFEQLEAIKPEYALLAKELVRSSIFIERSPSGAKEGAAYSTVRWHFRRMLLPHFKTALRRWGYVSLNDINELTDLLTDVSNFRSRTVAKYKQESDNQPDFWSNNLET